MSQRLNSELAAWRRSRGLTLREVSDLTGVSVSMLSRVERGEREMSPITKLHLSRRLGIRERDVFDLKPSADGERASDVD